MTTPHSRQELNPPTTTTPPDEIRAAPRRTPSPADSPDVQGAIESLVRAVGGNPDEFAGSLVKDLVTAGLKLIPDGRNTGELKLITAAVKELRYAYRVFAQYPDPPKVSIFGSARTPPEHPDYRSAVEFSRLMAEAGWMSITGAGDGIMRAGHEGPGADASFGVAIRLPFETSANEVIKGDEKLIHFRYFFTRKLMFLSQCDAVALFPGGFGTLDEAYETLTLIQTGKAAMMPIVMLEGEGNAYWEQWQDFVRTRLLARGLISPEDLDLYYVAAAPQDAVDHIIRFYRNYHSSRYVRDDLIIRLRRRLRDDDVARLAEQFRVLIKSGTFVQRGPYDVEDDALELPRLCFTHTRSKFGLVRRLIDEINRCEPAA
ncbi:MAG: LOG family protein [Phycisphaeraceae bacterium]|nr:LOG family protein [Phycisphaeraceae bacterium]